MLSSSSKLNLAFERFFVLGEKFFAILHYANLHSGSYNGLAIQSSSRKKPHFTLHSFRNIEQIFTNEIKHCLSVGWVLRTEALFKCI